MLALRKIWRMLLELEKVRKAPLYQPQRGQLKGRHMRSVRLGGLMSVVGEGFQGLGKT
jgi:hypothetical protein